MSRTVAGWLLVAGLLAGGCGSSEPTQSARKAPDPFRAVPQKTIVAPADKAAPRWETVTTLRGSGSQTKTVTIAGGAIQWRARWRCTSGGRLTVAISPPPPSGPARGAGDCPGSGSASWVTTGSRQLRVSASGAWRVTVEQEVDTPLHEAPLSQMRAAGAKEVARGDFYKVERKGGGRATLYRLPGGRLALRLANFATDSNTDLFVWLSEAVRPTTTMAASRARHIVLARLKSTIGDQNYLLPLHTDAAAIRSVVVWCDPVQIAYTAATLRR